ncbi:MAG TPA: PLP-dependent aminotransferase family protein [Dermatophilaceae bacterium]|nr:PLP-dependent aminotransferase family protein [Dermatophilaceae bacterium]
MDLHLTLSGRSDLTAQVYLRLRAAVLDGRLGPGDRLPSTRELADELDVSRGTVTTAYDRLVAEGFLESRRGAGTFVRCAAPGVGSGRRRASPGVVGPVPPWQAQGSPAPSPSPAAYELTFDLTVGVPDAGLFPLAVWRRLVAAELRLGRLGQAVAGTYVRPGHPRLQAEIARYLGRSRSVVASAEDVLVTTGAQQALDLVARVLLEPGAVVAVEDPGYTAAARLFETHRAQVVGVPVDEEGIVVQALPARARLVYVTPSHQFPLGVAMSLTRRVALLEWASRHGAVIVEDDYDSEFRFADRPLEPLQSLDAEGRVVYVGTFSKTLLPGLRVGYAIAPSSLQPALREAKQVTDWSGDAVTQGALAAFLAEGHLAAHVRRATKVYGDRRRHLLAEVGRELGDVLEFVPSVAGLHVTALLRDAAVDDRELAAAVARAGVGVEPLSPRYRGQPRPGLMLGIGGVDQTRLPDALALVVQTVRRRLAG